MKSTSTHACSLTPRLEQLHDEYVALLAAVTRIRSTIVAARLLDPQLSHELESLVKRIHQQEELLVGIRKEWDTELGVRRAELRSRIDATAGQLEQLIVLIQECERMMRSSREELRPQWNQASRHREMQRAYREHQMPVGRQ